MCARARVRATDLWRAREGSWREREGSLRGLADAIDGRSWGDVASRFERIWVCAMRGMDDIKVRTRSRGD